MMNTYLAGKKPLSKALYPKKCYKGHKCVVAKVFSRKAKEFGKYKNGNKLAKYEKEALRDTTKEKQHNYKLREEK